MIETIENAIQLIVTGLCAVSALTYAVRSKERAWVLLGLSAGLLFLGDLYWQLFLVFYDKTPSTFYISDFSWYTSYLFLLLLLIYINVENSQDWQFRLRPGYLLIPAFTFGMCAFFMTHGDYLSNIIAALLMTGLIWHSVYGLQMLQKQKPKNQNRGGAQPGNRRMLYIVTLIFCGAEYGMWISSCFWMGDTITNVYFWFDFLLSISFVLFLPALRKAVGR